VSSGTADDDDFINHFADVAGVAYVDNCGWSLYGAQWLQPVAISRKCNSAKNGRNKPKPLPCGLRPVAFGMVRRGLRFESGRGLSKAPRVSAFVVQKDVERRASARAGRPLRVLSVVHATVGAGRNRGRSTR
jgi:hypothetical protein